jgi:hypothetical protein
MTDVMCLSQFQDARAGTHTEWLEAMTAADAAISR